jgi:hypothetical protein
VTAKCGHVGRNYYILKEFAVVAENGKEAAKKVREYARVKHHQKDAIKSVKKLSEGEYITLKEQNVNDEYFRCKNVQEQKRVEGLMEVRIPEEVKKFSNSRNVFYKKERQRIIDEEMKALIKNYLRGA